MNKSLDLMYEFIYNHATVNEKSAYPICLLDHLNKSISSVKNNIDILKKSA